MTFAAVVRSEVADGVAGQIRDAILAGEYQPGDLLPSERELSQQFDANRTTIREGLAQLEHQGLIERRQGARVASSTTAARDRSSCCPISSGCRATDAARASRRRSRRPTRCSASSTTVPSTSRSSASPPPRSRNSTGSRATSRPRRPHTTSARWSTPTVPSTRASRDALDRARAPGGQLLPRDRCGRGALQRAQRHRRPRAHRPRRAGRPPSPSRAGRRHRRGQARRSTRRRPPDARRRRTNRSHDHTTGEPPMTTETKPPLPDGDEVDATIKRRPERGGHDLRVELRAERDQLVTLYNKGVSSQWNSVTDLDWATDVDPEELVRTSRRTERDRRTARRGRGRGSPLATWGEKEFTAARHRDVQGAAEPVHARRAGRDDGRGQDRRDGAVDRRQVLRGDPDDGRGAPHRGVRQVPRTPSSARRTR